MPKFYEKARCKDYSTNIFYPEKDNQRKFPPKIYKSAKNICAKCPVQLECLEYALENAEVLYGVWGGKSPPELKTMYIKLFGHEAWGDVKNGVRVPETSKTERK